MWLNIRRKLDMYNSPFMKSQNTMRPYLGESRGKSDPSMHPYVRKCRGILRYER